MDTLMEILEAVGVGAAAGLSPLVAVAAVILLAAVHLGINPAGSDFGFVTEVAAVTVAAVTVAAVVLIQSFLMIIAPGGISVRIAADRRRWTPLHLAGAALLGGIAGAVVLG
ncbi:MAG: hypothetical protein WAP37_09525, partial [Solirubrobacterales bacterium]